MRILVLLALLLPALSFGASKAAVVLNCKSDGGAYSFKKEDGSWTARNTTPTRWTVKLNDGWSLLEGFGIPHVQECAMDFMLPILHCLFAGGDRSHLMLHTESLDFEYIQAAPFHLTEGLRRASATFIGSCDRF